MSLTERDGERFAYGVLKVEMTLALVAVAAVLLPAALIGVIVLISGNYGDNPRNPPPPDPPKLKPADVRPGR